MAQDEKDRTDRRTFIQAGALATAAAATLAGGATAQELVARSPVLPRRKLGKTGVEVTMLEQGAVQSPDRVLRMAYANGIRIFDTAKLYHTEANFKSWFEQSPEVRKEIFLVTKDMPRTAGEIPKMVDDRLKSLGTDTIDLFFIHGFGDMHRLNTAVNLIKSKELASAVDAVKKAGKIKFFGFSSHNKDRAALIEAAAQGGIVDAIMLQYTPWLDKDSPLNKALDVAWQKGLGLISMKQIASASFGDRPKGDILEEVVKRVPTLAEKKLTKFQGLLHAIWSDERISTVCVSMKNTDHVRDNADAARRFAPLTTTQIHELRDAVLAQGPTFCADCDGRCSLAAGTTAELGNLTRFLTYYQFHGDRALARREFAALAEECRDWSSADLEAARSACPNHLNFAELLPKVERYLA
jgi:uncharacterized protein